MEDTIQMSKILFWRQNDLLFAHLPKRSILFEKSYHSASHWTLLPLLVEFVISPKQHKLPVSQLPSDSTMKELLVSLPALDLLLPNIRHNMKRSSTVEALTYSQKRRKRKSAIMAFFCPADKSGPRIPTLLREFDASCEVDSHSKWLRLLHSACERQRCHVSDCSTGDYFSQTHGAKTLVNAFTMYLTYYVPRKVVLRSDDEWRQVLAALRTFHDFCVRRGYVKHDPVLMTALHRLRRFRICSIPERLEQLTMQKYWDAFETPNSAIVEDNDIGTGSTVVDQEDRQVRTGEQSSIDKTVQSDSQPDGEIYTYESFLGDEEPLSVEQIMDDGWVIYTEDSDGGERRNAFLRLPEDLAKLGMEGMSLSCMKLALRNGVWRPIVHDGMFVANAYPPDDVFYY